MEDGEEDEKLEVPENLQGVLLFDLSTSWVPAVEKEVQDKKGWLAELLLILPGTLLGSVSLSLTFLNRQNEGQPFLAVLGGSCGNADVINKIN